MTISAENAGILRELKGFLLSQSLPAFLVGGYIRDSLLDLPTKDVDIAVPGEPLSVARGITLALGGTLVPLSPSHGIARVVTSSSDGNRWVIDVSGFPDTIDGDLAKRDYGLDAMALSVEHWGAPGWQEHIHDPWGGKRDLAQGVIRAIAPSIFMEDPARLLRGVRLAARLGFRIEGDTAQLISREAHRVSSVAGERLRDEFLGILSLDRAKDHLETLDELGLLCCIIPELGITKGVEQPKEHHWPVFEHSLHTVEGVERVLARSEDDPAARLVPWGSDADGRFGQEVSDGHSRRTMVKLSGLLHDIAKPQTKMVDASGRTRFLGHHTLGAGMSSDILHRLRVSNRGSEMVATMVENHLRPVQMSQGGDLPTPRAVYRYFRDVGDVAVDTLYLSLADHLAARGPDLEMASWAHHLRTTAHVLETGTQDRTPEKTPRLVTGHDLIRELGLAPGPVIGALLEDVEDAQGGGDVTTREDALVWARSRLEVLSRTGGRPGPDPEACTSELGGG